MKHSILILTFLFSNLLAEDGKLIVLYGTPCSGKSTLAKQLEKSLTGNYKAVKRTLIVQRLRKNYIEQKTGRQNLSYSEIRFLDDRVYHKGLELKDQALDPMIYEIEQRLKNGDNLIFDVCLYREDQLEKLSHLKPIYVLVYAPLSDLSIREQERSQTQNCSIFQQERFREYILKGFSCLYRPSPPEKSYGSLSKNEVVDYYLTTRSKWMCDELSLSAQQIITDYRLKSDRRAPFAPRKKPTVFIDTSKMTPSESVRLIQNWI